MLPVRFMSEIQNILNIMNSFMGGTACGCENTLCPLCIKHSNILYKWYKWLSNKFQKQLPMFFPASFCYRTMRDFDFSLPLAHTFQRKESY